MDGDAGGVVNRDALRSYVRRCAHVMDERDNNNADLREVYKEAKDAGFDTTILREIVREFRSEADVRSSRYALLDAYRGALGMLAGTPLGDWATREDPKPVRRRGRKPRAPDFDFDDEHAGTA